MGQGFSVTEKINRPVEAVWSFLTDFSQANKWMTGIDGMRPINSGPIGLGTRLQFTARGAERETEVTAFEPQKKLALTSTQGGVTATYVYSLFSAGEQTEIRLHATCKASGLWKLIHPIILLAMKKSDSSHLIRLKEAIERE